MRWEGKEPTRREVNAGVRAAAGDDGGAKRVWKEGVKTLAHTVDGMTNAIPVVGHLKGAALYTPAP